MPGLSSPGESRVGCPGSDCVKGPMFLDACARAFFTWGITCRMPRFGLCKGNDVSGRVCPGFLHLGNHV